MRRALTGRIERLENKADPPKVHCFRASSEAEAQAIQEEWEAGPYSKLPGHDILIITRVIYDAPQSYEPH